VLGAIEHIHVVVSVNTASPTALRTTHPAVSPTRYLKCPLPTIIEYSLRVHSFDRNLQGSMPSRVTLFGRCLPPMLPGKQRRIETFLSTRYIVNGIEKTDSS
jgi:hypothetical protein